MRRLALAGGTVVVLGLSFLLLPGPLLDVLWCLPFGWLAYVRRVFPKVTISWAGVATALLCLALFTCGLHRMLRWFSAELQRTRGVPDDRKHRWSFRQTASLVALIVAMFVAGISATGIAHQAGWLLASRHSLVANRPNPAVGWGTSTGNLQQIGLVLPVILDPEMSPIRSGPNPEAPQSWMTQILPFTQFVLAGEIRRDLPWNHPRNSAYFKDVVPIYVNPQIDLYRDPEGYALGHYAGNVHVLGQTPRATRPPTDRAHTIVAGEVTEGFRPWGDPSNLRDPGLGVNQVPGGFGGPSGTGANFLFADGSVRFLSDTTSPEILRRLSRPQSSPR